MNDQALYEKQQAVKELFDSTNLTKSQKEQEVRELDIELNRLQGRYSLLEDLRAELGKVTMAPATDPAATLPADPLNRAKKDSKNAGK